MKFGQVLLLAAVNYVVHGHSVSIETVERLKIIMIEKTWRALRKGGELLSFIIKVSFFFSFWKEVDFWAVSLE